MFLHFILCLCTYFLAMSSRAMMNNIAKPNCTTRCGDVSIPYPFGIGNDTGCPLNNDFYLTCTSDKLFLKSSNLQVYNISDSEIRIYNTVSFKCYDESGYITVEDWWKTTLVGPFTFSEKNVFTVVGCDDYALIKGEDGDDFSSGCLGLCSSPSDVPAGGHCSGKGCCQTSIAKGLKYYSVTLETFQKHKHVLPDNNCGLAFLGEKDPFRFRGASDLLNATDLFYRVKASVPIVLDWVVAPDKNCSHGGTECKGNSKCEDVDGGGYRCSCEQGYEGNPYLDPGCQDINECLDPKIYPCHGHCENTPGDYNCTCPLGFNIVDAKSNNCTCPQGYNLDAKHPNRCTKDTKFSAWIIIIIGTGIGMSIIFLGVPAIFFCIRKRKLTRLREKFFEQNGGVFLKQKIKSQGSHEAMTLFSTEQLLKATNNYSQENIVGRGAYGVVYHGVLSDKRVVAIKKSKVVDQSQAEQFINEVMILTQVIHRNVVKLLGCCLEEEVPILVYEFISNNTLFHHIHNRLGGMSWLSWDNRVRVAAEAASALAYLHSDTIMPIVHRDVKSTNILLDDNYTAKISDFGASRLVPLDHDQVSTLVQGTLGYLDPQYFHSSQLTDKSDVYSFGVVLAELITGKKAIGADRINKEKNLATYFVNSVKENRVFEIVEPRLLREGTLDNIQALANLVKRCLKWHGEDRPTMKEVAVELDGLRKFTWSQPETRRETRNLEIEHSDLYDVVPLVPYGTNEWESFSGSNNMVFEENKPR